MYTAFYHLNEKPFRISSDPAFIWLGEKHREALATLRYAILDNKGFMLLTGDVGTGKTTLINALIKNLSADVYYASVPDPRLELGDFLNYVGNAFHIDQEFESKGTFLLHFGWFLEAAYKQKKKVLLIVDEAQLLSQSLLEEIRLLSNINRDGNHLLNIFLVGQNEFNEILARPVNRAVAQRLTLNYNIEPLSLPETEKYIKHRLKVAGGKRMLFSPAAVKAIHAYSGGIPRRINIVCDHCLLTGYVEEKQKIDADIVNECAKDIEIPTPEKPRQPDQESRSPEESGQPQPAAVAIQPQRRRWPAVLLSFILAALMLLSGMSLFFFTDPERFLSLYREGGAFLEDRTAVVRGQDQKEEDDEGAAEADSGEEKLRGSPAPPDAPDDSQTQVSGAIIREETHSSTPSVSFAAAPVDAPPEEDGAQPMATKVSGDAEPADVGDQPDIAENDRQDLEIAASPDLATTEHMPKKQAAMPAAPLPRETIVVRFDSDSNDFYTADLENLAGIVAGLKAHPEARLTITGYTDSVGPAAYNDRLSLFRANVVKSYLLGKGVNAGQLTVEGRGSRNPIGDNQTPEGRRTNRRVEVGVERQ